MRLYFMGFTREFFLLQRLARTVAFSRDAPTPALHSWMN